MKTYCCKCRWQNDETFEDRKFYRLPKIVTRSIASEVVIGYQDYCEECAAKWLEQFREEEDG